ncbi:MAG: hypothetical protein ACRC3J_05180 [Culicoidibacterales bacterium]
MKIIRAAVTAKTETGTLVLFRFTNTGCITFIGNECNETESELEALVRTFKEQTGYDLTNERAYPFSVNQPSTNTRTLTYHIDVSETVFRDIMRTSVIATDDIDDVFYLRVNDESVMNILSHNYELTTYDDMVRLMGVL